MSDNGRSTDPAMAAFIPVHVLIEHRKDETAASENLPYELKHFVSSSKVVVRSWSRETDEILEWVFTDPVASEMRKQPLGAEDAKWLHNIGARP